MKCLRQAIRPSARLGALTALAIITVVTARGGNIEKANNNTVLSTGTSWVGNTAPGSGDTALFDSTLTTTASATIGTGLSVNGVTVTNTGVSFTISANGTKSLTIGGGGIDLTSANNSTNNFTIAAAVVLGAAQTFNVAAGRTLTVSGTINNGGYDLTLAGAGANTLSGIISGAGNLVVAGNGGTWNLSGANTFTGNVTVRAGTLQVLTNNKALGAGSATLGDSSTLSTDDLALLATSASRTFSNDLTVANFGNSTTLGGNNTGTTTFSGNLTLNKDATLTEAGSGTVIFSGNISGTSNLTVTGSGTVQLKGTNDTNLGNVTISSGTLSIAGGSALGANSTVTIDSGANLATTANETIGTLTGAGNVTLSNAVVLTVGANNQNTTFSGIAQGGNANSGLAKTGTATLTLNGASNYTGPTTVNSGTLLLDLSTNPTGVLAATKPTLGGGTLQVNGSSSGVSSQTLGNLTLTANTASAIVVNGNGGTGTTLTLGSTWTRNAGSTLNIDISAANSILASSIALTNGIINAGVTVTDSTGTGFATTSGGNVVRFTPTNQLTSAATTQSVNYYDNTTGTLTLSGTEKINSLAINATSTGTLDLKGGTLTLTSLGVLNAATAGYTISNGTLGANNKEVIVHQTSSSDLTISATVGSGSGSLTKDGTGNLILTNNNTYTGTTVISAGTLTLAGTGGNQALAGTTSITLNSGGTLLTNTGNQTNSSANVTLNGGTLALDGQTNGAAGSPGLNVLTLTANSTLDLGGSGGSIIAFANSSAANWTAGTTLTITNWDGTFGNAGSNQIFFGSDSTGLTATQLSDIVFLDTHGQPVAYGATLLSNGELLTPVPEPSTYLAGASLILLAGLREWRRKIRAAA